MTVLEIFAAASADDWLVASFALLGAGCFCVALFRVLASAHDKYVSGEYRNCGNNHDQ
ncbi:MAG: hypothetical protein U1A72_23265 [Sulfuritalea sp.]|nr:hypothetical protein [Sulfuritalea sp.]